MQTFKYIVGILRTEQKVFYWVWNQVKDYALVSFIQNNLSSWPQKKPLGVSGALKNNLYA